MNKDFTLLDILRVLGKWKKHILITTGLVGILSVIGALTMPNYYKSSATFYAAHPDLATPDAIGGQESRKFIYGTNDDLDRLFSLANSAEVRRHLVSRFDLYKYYNIDSTTSEGKAMMVKRFSKLYNTSKTKFDAMTISMEDLDPAFAKEVVTEAREHISKLAQTLIKTAQKVNLDKHVDNIKAQEENLVELNDSLIGIKKEYKIYDSKSQGEFLAEQITTTSSELQLAAGKLSSAINVGMPQDSVNRYKAQKAGLERQKKNLESSVNLFNQGILSVKTLEHAQTRMSDELSLEKERYKKLYTSYSSPFTAVHLIEREDVPVEKSRPRRSILVLGLTALAFLLSCLVVLFLDATKEINWRDIFNGK